VVAGSPEEFAAAVRMHRLDAVRLEGEAVERAGAALAAAGLLVVGEAHGVRETPNVLYALARALGARAVAFEWSHEELEAPLQAFMRTGGLDLERLWSLPASAEFFCGDGRITAGHFALLQRLRDDDRLDQAIVYDRLDPEPPPADPFVRERDLAGRLLSEWDDRFPLIVLTGAGHARLDGAETMASWVARRRPGLAPAMIEYERGQGWFHGLYDLSEPMPAAPITLRVREATPAVVPGRATSSSRRRLVP
jgi:hypothetical protein